MKSGLSKNKSISCGVWVVLALMTIVFSGPIRRYLEFKWTNAAAAATPLSGERKAKMSTRVSKERQYIAELSQCISDPPFIAEVSLSSVISNHFPVATSSGCSFYYDARIKGASPIYLSVHKLQV